MSTRAEQITSEVKKLVLKCRQLEADLAKSVPKKTMDEAVAKMQARIDALDAELNHTRSDLASAISMNTRMDGFGTQLSQQGEIISSQNEVIKSISARFDTMVPTKTYDEVTARMKELERAIEVKNQEYAALQGEKTALEQTIAQMVPQDRYAAVQAELANSVPKSKYDEDIARFVAETVPKDQYRQIETRLATLEAELANSVPKSEFEQLSQNIVSLTKSVPTIEGDFAGVNVTTPEAPSPVAAAN